MILTVEKMRKAKMITVRSPRCLIIVETDRMEEEIVKDN